MCLHLSELLGWISCLKLTQCDWMLNKLQKPTFKQQDLSCKPLSITTQSKTDRNQAKGTCVQQMFCNPSNFYSCFHSPLTTVPLRSVKLSEKYNNLSIHHAIKHVKTKKIMTDLGFQKKPFFFMPSVGLLDDQYYTELDRLRKLSSGFNELLIKRQACWTCWRGSLTELHKLNSLFLLLFVPGVSRALFHLPLLASRSRVLSVLLSSCSCSLPFCAFSVSIDLPLSRKIWF